MPRPNPPRKRPRKRPPANQAAARADAALTRQTAQSTQSKTPPASKQQLESTATAAAVPAQDEMWAKRSYAILIVLVALVQLPLGVLYWALQPAVANGVAKGPFYASLPVLNPITLVVASLIAAPLARQLAGERRPLRFVESIFVGVVAYFIWVFLAIAVGFLLTAGTQQPGSSGTTPTPCPASATACTTPASTPTPEATPSRSPAASPSGSATTPGALSGSPAVVYGSFVIIDVLAFVGTYYLYPPLYKRMRVRRPPPAPRKPASKRSDARK